MIKLNNDNERLTTKEVANILGLRLQKSKALVVGATSKRVLA